MHGGISIVAIARIHGTIVAGRSAKELAIARNPVSVAVRIVVVGHQQLLVRLSVAVIIPPIAPLSRAWIDGWVKVIAVSALRRPVTARWCAKALVIARNPVSVAVRIVVIGGAHLFVRLSIAVVIPAIACLGGAWVDGSVRVIAVSTLRGSVTA
jgi:hypothetical protein